MEIEKIVKEAIKENKAIYGYRKAYKYLKNYEPKLVIIAKNMREDLKNDIISAVRNKNLIKEFNGTSIELGILCGKPFPISVIVIKNDRV
ncbi:MAG: ribosomal L7Ae/L30e/S12e/Gadd45 family protein [Candidatus Aenigmatarchaeota archaeon]